MKKLLILILCTACFINVYADKRKNSDNIGAIITYNLPKRVVDVTVELSKTIYQEGPFAQYAQKLLSIPSSSVIKNTSSECTVSKISLKGRSVLDTRAAFKMKMIGAYEELRLSYTSQGFLASFNAKDVYNPKEEKETTYQVKDEKKIEDIFPESFIVDRTYKIIEEAEVKIDSLEMSFEKKSKNKSQAQRILKSNEEKAKDAAHLLFKLRKRRFKILTCNYKILPQDGKSYKEIVKHLKKLEKRYLELFTGRKIHRKIKRTFCTEIKKDEKSVLVARYNDEGKFFTKGLSGTPIHIDLSNITYALPKMTTVAKPGGNFIYYRLPVHAQLNVFDGKRLVAYKRMILPQWGAIGKLSTDILIDRKLAVEFYPQYGTIKRIYTK